MSLIDSGNLMIFLDILDQFSFDRSQDMQGRYHCYSWTILLITFVWVRNASCGTDGCCLPKEYQMDVRVYTNSPRHVSLENLHFASVDAIPATRIDYYANFSGHGDNEHVTL